MTELLDVQCGFGGAPRGQREMVGVADLVGAFDRVSISGGLVRLTPEDMDLDFELSNRRLFAACASGRWP